jgi:UDP-glucose 4-epimerase
MYDISNANRNVNHIKPQKGDVDITSSNINKATSLLGFNPQVSIREGLIKQFTWQKELLLKNS